jgi:hypothetical protein
MSPEASKPPVMIICGGRGDRFLASLDEEERKHGHKLDAAAIARLRDTPKPLLPIGPASVVEHLMRGFRLQGFDDFIIMAGENSDSLRAGLQGLEKTGFKIEYRRQDEGKPLLPQISAMRQRLGERFFLAIGVALSDGDYEGMLAEHLRGGEPVTTLYQQRGFRPYAGVSIVDTKAFDEPGLEERLLSEYNNTRGRYYPASNESAMWEFIGGGKPTFTQNHTHIRRLDDLVYLQKEWAAGNAFWAGAYERGLERLPVEGVESAARNPRNASGGARGVRQ